VDTVDIGDNETKVIPCQHVSGCRVQWLEFSEIQAPGFWFTNFPASGLVVLSKNEIHVVCHRCFRVLDDLKNLSSHH
jgi:hypothetical protein